MICALASIATTPSRIHKMFLTSNYAAEGIVSMLVYIKGRPEVITIDDKLPYGTGNTLFLRKTADSAYWAHFAEKLFAKINVNYEYIGFGWMSEALYIFTGAPTVMMKPTAISTDNLWSVMADAYKNNFILTAACMTAQSGVIGGHAYSVLGVTPIYDAQGALVERLVLVRNPWGYSEFIGNWSDSSSVWTAAFKAQVPNHPWSTSDGAFYMSVKDFQSIFAYYTITYYHDDYNLSFYEANGLGAGRLTL